MLFHVGALWRLNELGSCRSSTGSRASRAARSPPACSALPGRGWTSTRRRRARNFVAEVVEPVRALAGTTIDAPAILGGLLHAAATIGEQVAARLPRAPVRRRDAAGPARTPALRHQRDQRADRRAVALLEAATWPTGASARSGSRTCALADAVAASSAFPPVLSPLRLDLDPRGFDPRPRRRPARDAVHRAASCSPTAASTTTSGSRRPGSAAATVLVSDGGGKMAETPSRRRLGAQTRAGQRGHRQPGPQPAQAPGRSTAFARGRARRLLGHPTDIADYALPPTRCLPGRADAALAETPTRLAKLDDRSGAPDQLGLRGVRRRDAPVGRARRHGARPRSRIRPSGVG